MNMATSAGADGRSPTATEHHQSARDSGSTNDTTLEEIEMTHRGNISVRNPTASPLGSTAESPPSSGETVATQADPPASDLSSQGRAFTSLSGETLPEGWPGPDDPTATASAAVNSPPITPLAPTRSSTLLSIWSSTSAGLTKIGNWLGIDFAREEDADHDKTLVIKVNKSGRWIIFFHLTLAINGLFGLGTTIYSWYSDAQNNSTMQQIMKMIAQSNSNLEEKFREWASSAKNRTAEMTQHQAEEQRLWDALHQTFEECAIARSSQDAAASCDELRHFFDTHPLPRPDNSPLAKRNALKLHRIIRRTALQGSPMSSSIGETHETVQANIVLGLLTVAVLAALLLLGRTLQKKVLSKASRWMFSKKSHSDEDLEEKDHHPDDQDAPSYVPTTALDLGPTPGAAQFRGSRKPEPHALAARGATDELRDLIGSDWQFDVNNTDASNEYGTILAAAARSGSLETVEYVLSRKPNVNLQGGRYQTALQAAAYSGSEAIVARLLAASAREESVGGFYGTAINAAAEKGSLSMLEHLLNCQAVLKDAVNQEGGTYGYPLIAAAARGRQDAVELLLKHEARADLPNKAGTIALHSAAVNGNLKLMDLLIEAKCNINQVSSVFGTALHAACRESKVEAAKKLLEAGANTSVEDARLRLSLHEAAQAKGDLFEVVHKILETRPDLVDCADVDGNTALHLASIAGSTKVVRTLLRDFHANCAAKDKFQAEPLFRAAGCGYPEIVRDLLKIGGANPNARDSFGRTALHGPAETDELAILHEYLIEAEADINLVGNDKKTALHEACNMGRKRNVELLLAQPEIKVNELDADQFPPLYKALCSSDGKYLNECVNPDIVTLLLARDDIDVNVSDGIAAQEAARKGLLDVLQKMLDLGADVQVRGGKYGGVLQAAAMSGNLILVNRLLEPQYRADVNLEGGQLGSPLAAAAAFGHLDIMRRLLEAGANPCMFEVGQYGSSWQSVCKKIDPKLLARNAWKWKSIAGDMRGLLQEYGGPEAARKVDMPYEDWRWLMSTAGWAWLPPGDM